MEDNHTTLTMTSTPRARSATTTASRFRLSKRGTFQCLCLVTGPGDSWGVFDTVLVVDRAPKSIALVKNTSPQSLFAPAPVLKGPKQNKQTLNTLHTCGEVKHKCNIPDNEEPEPRCEECLAKLILWVKN